MSFCAPSRTAPDQRIDVVNDLMTRRGPAFAYGCPDIHAIKGLVLPELPARDGEQRRVDIDDVEQSLNAPGLDLAAAS